MQQQNTPSFHIKFVKDKLPFGFVYPCSVNEIKQLLSKLPEEHIEGLKRVRFAVRKSVNADASYADGTITVYAVPRDFKFIYLSGKPPERVMKEYGRFGGRWENFGETWVCYWKTEQYKRYILEHVFLHEIGHHLDEYHSMRTSLGKEEFAEKYALLMEEKLYREKEH